MEKKVRLNTDDRDGFCPPCNVTVSGSKSAQGTNFGKGKNIMRKFMDIENDAIYTYDELVKEYCKLVIENGPTEEYYLYTPFEKWLADCCDKNGSLREVVPQEWNILVTITMPVLNGETSDEAKERILMRCDPDLEFNFHRATKQEV